MKRAPFVVLLAVLAAGCTGQPLDLFDLSGGSESDVTSVADVSPGTADGVPEAIAESDRVVPGDGGIDFGTEMPFMECEPGTGCFLDQCGDNTDCQSGFCVEHMGEAVCTKTCKEDCPPGWSCKLITESEPDLVYICVSDFSNLCKPCAANSDCKSYGGSDDACIGYGDEGSFCGGACSLDADCPWGFACKEVSSVDGAPLTQCFAEAGVCPCTDQSAEKGLATTCAVENEWGVCEGMRFCTAQGLSACDAGTPEMEICNGLDDDCDGEVDEPVVVEGKYVDQCDDENDCTVDSCQGEEGCVQESLSEGECVDGDACTVGDHCEDGQCVGLPIVCDDGNPCTDDLCDGKGGCKVEFNMEACDDGDPCTVGDVCGEGECVGYEVDCECQEDADCAGLEDGDLCNGVLFCDQAKLPYHCAVAPDTMVVCAEPQDGATICLNTACESATGECVELANNEGYACDDGDPCTVGDKCIAGECGGGVPVSCDDQNPCTTQYCDDGVGCVYQDNFSTCSDGDVCTVNDLCSGGECIGGASLKCDDGNECTADSCDSAVGCVHVAAAGECDDGNACTEGDHCQGGKCVFTSGTDCNDGNPCTQDTCAPWGGCTYQVIAGACDDGDPCTVNDTCVNGACVAGLTMDCNDGNVCTADSCLDLGVCLHDPVEGECTDGDECTTGDHCAAGECFATDTLVCDDGNPCTADTCYSKTGCVSVQWDGPCSDGDPCTINDMCSGGSCAPGPEVDCDDDNDCTDDQCGEMGLCIHTGKDAQCTDGNACTLDDHCSGGKCVATQSLFCDDSDVCTSDSCDPVQGCVHNLNSAPCDDEDLCTTGDHCHLGECIATADLTCNDGNPCTDDGCNSASGCQFAPNQAQCDDGNECTENDLCSGGACTGGTPADCDDDNPCTDDLCDVVNGCMHFDNNQLCNDLNACTANEFCSGGQCGGGVPIICDDQNLCTDNSCEPATGCVYDNNNAQCTDLDECTDGDQCAQGACVPGGAPDCDDANVCTDDSCEAADGCHHDPVADDTECGLELWCQAGECVPTLACDAAAGHFVIITSSQNWEVPGDVSHVRVMVVGGGGGGAKGHGNGGGSGHVRKGEYNVEPCAGIQITVGGGGSYNSNGQSSSFGSHKTASGGNAGQQNSSGSGAGGSGGGGAGNSGCGGDGGTGGANGQGGCTYGGGAGGNFDNVVGGFFQHASMSHGAGGSKGSSSHAGGGGGGGVLVNGQGTGGAKGEYSWSAYGGAGYGGGGGGGGYNGPYANGGTGGKGVVYVEWD